MTYKYDNSKVFKYFEEISKVPRGSYNEKEVSDYIVSIAKDLGLEYKQDDKYNVYIKKPATKGYEKSPGVIIQGHMDMVCEKANDSDHDFKKDAIELIQTGDFIHANKTTLGADNGIAVAMGLAIISDETLEHPQIELILTTSEEEGMDGVNNLETGLLKGKYMINIDTEEEGVLIAGCAGGETIDLKLKNDYEKSWDNAYEIHISEFRGGHSGMEIAKGYLNAIKVLGELLKNLKDEIDFRLVEIDAGTKHNVIPRDAKIIITSKENIDTKIIEKLFEKYQEVEKDGQIDIKKIDNIKKQLSEEETNSIINILNEMPNGVFNYMDGEYSHIVETSCNVAIFKMTEDNTDITISIRSSKIAKSKEIFEIFKGIAEKYNMELETDGGYNPWEFSEESKLREIAADLYRKMYNKDIEISVIHAGLECAVFEEKYPDLDIISMGPNIYNAHTPEEKLSISSTQNVYDYVVELIKTIK